MINILKEGLREERGKEGEREGGGEVVDTD